VEKLGDVRYLRDFQVELEGVAEDQKPLVARYSLVLRSNTQYRLMICNADDSQGSGIIELYDNRKLIGRNFSKSTGKEYPSFDIQIRRSGVYHVFISFKDGKPGRAAGILAFVKSL